jgi:4-hydroxy-tetrahydrodipicolinate synthase
MKRIIFKGSAVAVVTPMLADGEINYPALRGLLNWQIAEGTDCIVICGTTGESATMTDEEQLDCIRFTVEQVAGRVPVIAGVGSNHTSHGVNLSKGAKQAGADGLLHVTPYYNKTSQKGLIAHFNAMADATDLPIVLYNVPGRTSLNIAPSTYKELSKHPNIVATKEASGDIAAVARTMELCGDDLNFYSGNDDMIVPLMSLGGLGVISVLANVMPALTAKMCRLFYGGDLKGAAALQIGLMGLIDALFCDVNPIPVKTALNLMGRDCGPMRLPLTEITDSGLLRLKEQLELNKLI